MKCVHLNRSHEINICEEYIDACDYTVPFNGMLNVSPIGRACSREEGGDFETWDKQTKCRETMVAHFRDKYPDLQFSICGQISFDVRGGTRRIVYSFWKVLTRFTFLAIKHMQEEMIMRFMKTSA